MSNANLESTIQRKGRKKSVVGGGGGEEEEEEEEDEEEEEEEEAEEGGGDERWTWRRERLKDVDPTLHRGKKNKYIYITNLFV